MGLAGPCGNFFRDSPGRRWLLWPIGIVLHAFLKIMKLTYRIEKRDHTAFLWHHMLRSVSAWRLYSVVLILGILALSYQSYELGTEFQSAITFIAGYILLMVLIFFVTHYVTIKASIRDKLHAGENNGVVGDHCLILDEAAVCEQAGHVEIRVKWIGIHKVSVGESHAFIYYNPQTAFIVPKRAFDDESDFNEFVRDCVSRLPEHTLNPRLDHAHQ